VQAAVQAPVEMVASSALSVASLAAQSLADVRRSVTLTGPCSLYYLTVAESGDRKSTVDRSPASIGVIPSVPEKFTPSREMVS